MKRLSIEDMASFCMRKGIVYPSGDIYGGEKGFFDLGPYGTELKRNISESWWSTFVRGRSDVVGVDGSIITNPAVWKASGHVDGFIDLILKSEDGSTKVRADHYLEDELGGDYDGVTADTVDRLVEEHELKAPNGEEWKPCTTFNLMFETHSGPYQKKGSKTYLRPETAQLIFTNFKYAKQNGRMKLPFGIAQEGKAFRNEISPRNFLFRTREFSQLELEYFVNPHDEPPFKQSDFDVIIHSQTVEEQRDDKEGEERNIQGFVEDEKMNTSQAYFLARTIKWFEELGVDTSRIRIREQLPSELAHYSSSCWDIEYDFPFGWSEVMGCADRGNHDLKSHQEQSGKKLSVYDQDKKEHVIPEVAAEPSLGVERALLVFLYDALYDDDRGNDTLGLHPDLSPYTVSVFPLVKKEEEIVSMAKSIVSDLQSLVSVKYDERGSIGKRYARQDEIGTPFCITVDFDSLDDDAATIRFRDSTEQERVSIDDLPSKIAEEVSNYNRRSSKSDT